MGNALTPCYNSGSGRSVKLVFWEGTTKIISGNRLACEIMFQFPDKVICHANSFYIGQRIPALSMDDELMNGETYFVIPIDRFSNQVLSVTSLAALASDPKRPSLKFQECPFEYVKGTNGRLLIKVSPEYLMRIMSQDGDQESCTGGSPLCSTPELQKHYGRLVGSKEQVWSPKLETISEYQRRPTPCMPLGLEWRSKMAEE